MNPALLLTNDNTLAYEDGGAGGTATGAGALRYRTGYFAATDAALVEEATTNALANPSFETNTTGWNGGGTITRITTDAWVGSASAQEVTANAASSGRGYQYVTGSDGQTFTFTAYVKGVSGGTTLEMAASLFTTTNTFIANIFAPSTITLTSGWVRHEWTFTLSGATIAKFQPYVVTPRTGFAATTFLIDGVQVEQKDHATSYADGSLGTGYAWTGTAHASTSTRTAASITVPYAGTVGSFACWYSEDFGATWNFHYAAGTGAIGTYGSIADIGTDLQITSSRALLLGPLAVWTDTLTVGEQADIEALTTLWTWSDISAPPSTATTAHDALTVTGRSATASAGTTAATTHDALTVTGQAVTATAQVGATATTAHDTLSITGRSVTASAGMSLTAATAHDTLAVTGQAVTASVLLGATNLVAAWTQDATTLAADWTATTPTLRADWAA